MSEQMGLLFTQLRSHRVTWAGAPREEVVIWAIHLFLDAWTGGEGIRETDKLATLICWTPASARQYSGTAFAAVEVVRGMAQDQRWLDLSAFWNNRSALIYEHAQGCPYVRYHPHVILCYLTQEIHLSICGQNTGSRAMTFTYRAIIILCTFAEYI